MISDLPKSLQRFIAKYPKVWDAYSRLGEECKAAGPLAKKQIHLVKIGIYGSKRQETPFKTHVRQALENGASEEEVNHVILQLLTAEGLGTTVRVWSWANEVIEDEARGRQT
jgi:alkylhydroperoxidase/carboxymuconolactone decarboxylase family protein YurZ